MTGWRDEIIETVRQRLKAAAEAAEREAKRKVAATEFWFTITDAVKAFCNEANGRLEKEVFIVVSVNQAGKEYNCSITYKGPTDGSGRASLDVERRALTITVGDREEKFQLERGHADGVVAVHANRNKFTALEVAEEFIRIVTQINAGRKFQKPVRSIRVEEELDEREAREV